MFGQVHLAEIEDDCKMETKKSELTADRIKCGECGAAVSSNGRPFTLASLKQHRRRMHPVPPVLGALVCDVCGATGGRRGKSFKDESDLLHHKNKAHARSVVTKLKVSGRKGKGREATATRRVAKFCPDCGCNLDVVNAALTIADGEGV